MNMRLTKMAAAVCALTSMAAAHAQSSVTVYGLVDLGVEYSKAGSSHAWREISGGSLGSRLGFRGVEDLGGGLSAVFRLESGINAQDGSFAQGGRAFGRESTVGLSSRSWGTVTLGRQSSPYYASLPWVDAFFWMGAGGILGLTRSTAAGTIQVLPMGINGRPDSSIGWVSPLWSGVELRALYASGSNSTTVGDTYGASARYVAGPIDAVAGYTRQKAGTAGTGAAEAAVVGGSYNFGPAKVYLGYTDEKNNCTNCGGPLTRPAGVTGTNTAEFRLINLGARVPFGPFTAIAQVVKVRDRSQYAVSPGNRDATWVGIGGEYNLSKRTLIYSSYGSISNQNGSQYAPGSGSSQAFANSVPAGDPRATAFDIGIRHVF